MLEYKSRSELNLNDDELNKKFECVTVFEGFYLCYFARNICLLTYLDISCILKKEVLLCCLNLSEKGGK